MIKKKIEAVLAAMAVILLAVPAHSQSVVDQGKPGTKGPWPVTIVGGGTGGGSGIGGGAVTGPDGGAVVVQNLTCANPVESVIIFDGGGATGCPVTPLAGRRTVLLCNSQKNSGSPLWTVSSGAAPTTALASQGQALSKGDCMLWTIGAVGSDGGNPLNCISDTSSSALNTTECK